MIRRVAFVIAFFLLGFASLWIGVSADLEICQIFPHYCQPRPGVCAELGKCSNSVLFEFGAVAFYFGPSIVFATVAHAFSKRRRSWLFWTLLPVVLFILHLIAIELLRL